MDRVDGQTPLSRTLLAMSGSPTRETTKKLYTRQELLAGGNRHDTGGDKKSHVLEVYEVRS